MRKILAPIAILAASVSLSSTALAGGGETEDAGTTIVVVPVDFCNGGTGYVDLDTPEWNQGQVTLHARVMLPGSIVEDYENIIGYGATADYGFSYVGESLDEAILIMLTAEYVLHDGTTFISDRVDVQMDDACLTVVQQTPMVFEPAPVETVPVVVEQDPAIITLPTTS